MDGKDLLSIREFATAAGVTTQSIYKRLKAENDPLQAYAEGEGKQRKIHKDGLQLFQIPTNYQPIDNKEPTNYQPVTNQLLDSKQDMIDTLKAQLEAKDRQIERMQEDHAAQLTAKDRQIDTLTQALAAAMFNAGQLQKQLTDTQSEGEASPGENAQSEDKPEPQKKPGLLARIARAIRGE